MDLDDEEWVNIPYDGFLEVHEDGDNKILSRKYVKSPSKLSKPTGYFDTQQNSQDFVEDESVIEKQMVPTSEMDRKDEVKEMIKLPILTKESKETSPDPEVDQDPIFQVFFKKENKFVEMKMDPSSPKLSSQEPESFQYQEMSGDHAKNSSSPSKMIKQKVVAWDESDKRLNFLKWGLSGIGAFCSIGMTAATICMIVFGNGRRHKQQKLRIQIYPENKRLEQVVQKANEAMSTVRGVPLVKAQITYGGYYESQ